MHCSAACTAVSATLLFDTSRLVQLLSTRRFRAPLVNNPYTTERLHQNTPMTHPMHARMTSAQTCLRAIAMREALASGGRYGKTSEPDNSNSSTYCPRQPECSMRKCEIPMNCLNQIKSNAPPTYTIRLQGIGTRQLCCTRAD